MSATDTQILIHRIEDRYGLLTTPVFEKYERTDLREATETLARLQMAETILLKILEAQGVTPVRTYTDRVFIDSSCRLEQNEIDYLQGLSSTR